MPLLLSLSSKENLTDHDITGLLRALIKSLWLDSPLYLVVRRVDECRDGIDQAIEILNSIVSIQHRSGKSCIKLMTTGLQSKELFAHMEGENYELRLTEQEEMTKTVKDMIQQKTMNLIELNPLWEEFQAQVHEKVNTGQPNFLLAHRQLRLLENPDIRSTKSAVFHLLDSIPMTLSDSYQQVLEGKPHDHQPWATTALKWLVHCFRLLKQNELAVVSALGSEGITAENLEDHCPRQVSEDVNRVFLGTTKMVRDEIQFTHCSLHDYLTTKSSEVGNQSKTSIHREMTKLCLDYIRILKEDKALIEPESIDLTELSSSRHLSLLEYAVKYWPHHFKAGRERYHFLATDISPGQQNIVTGENDPAESRISCEGENGGSVSSQNFAHDRVLDEGLAPELPLAVLAFLDDKELFSRWSKLAWCFDGSKLEVPQMNSVLEVAARYDLVELMAYYLAQEGNEEKILGAKLEKKAENHGGSSGEDEAISEQPQQEPETEEGRNDERRKIPEYEQVGHRGLDPVRVLDIACQFGSLNIVKLLRRLGVKSKAAILKAAETRQEKVCTFMIQENDKMGEGLTGNDCLDLLKILAGNGMGVAIDALLEFQPDLLDRTLSGSNSKLMDALKAAIENGHQDLVQKLKPPEASAGGYPYETRDKDNRLWSCVVERGYVEMAQVLLKLETPEDQLLQATDELLYTAAANGQLDLVRAVVNLSGSNVTFCAAGDLKRPLEVSSANGHWLVVEELLRRIKTQARGPIPGIKRRRTVQLDISLTKTQSQEEGESNGLVGKPNIELTTLQIPLHSALRLSASHGHLKIVRALLAFITKETVNGKQSIAEGIAKDSDGQNALHLAAANGHQEVVVELLEHEMPVESVSNSGWTAITYAVDGGFSKVVRILIQSTANVTIFDKEGNTPHHLAAERNSLATVRALQAISNNARLANKAGYTPLWLAAEKGNHSLIKALLVDTSPTPEGIQYQSKGSLLNAAVKSERLEIVKLFADIGEDCNSKDEDGDFPLALASAVGNVAIMKLLLDRGANIDRQNSEGETALFLAVEEDHREACALLLERGANPNIRSNDLLGPLFIAVFHGHHELITMLLSKAPDGIDLNQRNLRSRLTALHASCQSMEITKALLEAGANPNSRNVAGETPIFLAGEWGRKEIAKLVIVHGARVGIASNKNSTAAHCAARNDHLEVFKLLLANGADVNQRRLDGATAGHLAIEKQATSVFEFIVNESEADLDLVGRDFGTMLAFAAHRGNVEYVKILLKRGADVNVHGGEYHSALQAAVASENKRVVELILEKKPDINAIGGKFGSALHAAISLKLPDIFSLLLVQGITDVSLADEEGITPLELAARSSSVNFLEILKGKGVDLGRYGGKYGSALHAAIEKCSFITTEFLLKNGVDPQKTIEGKDLPIQFACKYGFADIVQLLCDHGAQLVQRNPEKPEVESSVDLALKAGELQLLIYLISKVDTKDEKDRLGQAGLNKAIESCSIKDVEQILKAGINSNTRNTRQETPIIKAIAKKDLEVIKSLLVYGVDPSLEDGYQRNALSWAAHYGFEEVFGTILEFLRPGESFGSCCNKALHAAIASKRKGLVVKLIEEHVDQFARDRNSWLPIQIAQIYGFADIEGLLNDEFSEDDKLQCLPSHWHEYDKADVIKLSADKTTLSIPTFDPLVKSPVARANFCIPNMQGNIPESSDLFYWEITIQGKGGIDTLLGKIISLGFCGEYTPLNKYMGFASPSWGFHSDDGKIYANGGDYSMRYGSGFGVGDIVGCGVILDRKVAFYTLNGRFLGIAFEDASGQVYPAISINSHLVGIEISTNFGQSKDRPFKYSYLATDIDEAKPMPKRLYNTGSGEEDQEFDDDEW
ncbi:Ankyrin-2 [Arthrobotrys entomopaga]|nr:Ankyrin-2 [Arthrobotrys entomopaga]